MTRDSYTDWHKSSYSNSTGGCVEVGVATGGGASRSGGGEAGPGADSEPVIGVRDTKQYGRGPILAFSPATWRAFLNGAKAGAFDL